MTTWLVTGAGGFLGSHVVEMALNRGDHVIAVDSFTDNGITDRLEYAIAVADGFNRTTVICHDLRAPFSDLTIGLARGVTAIVHAAARCSVDDSLRDPAGHVTNNVLATVNTLELARRIDADKFVLVSTDEVSPSGGVAHRPSSPYAASKAACEDVAFGYDRAFTLGLTTVTSQNLFGERQSSLAFIPRVLRYLLRDEVVPIHVGASGRPGWRWYSYAPNVAAWIVNGVYDDGPYPLRGQLGTDVLKLAQRIAELAGRELRYETVLAETVRPGWDSGYAHLESNRTWQPEVDADEGLRRTVEWFLERPEWLDV